MNEEVANKTVNLAVTGAKVTARALLRALAKANQELKQQKAVVKQKRNARKQMKANEPKHGKQTIKQLIGQGQGVSSMDVGDAGMRDFKRIANKYGVDFAIVKDKTVDPPRYVTFFKARDADAINQVLKEYTAKQLKRKSKAQEKQDKKKDKGERESVLKKLKIFKDRASKTPKKEVQKKKEQVL